MRSLLFPIILMAFCWGMLYAKSKFFLEDFDFQTPHQELLTLFPEKKEEINSIFRQTPFYTNVLFSLPVKKRTLRKMFTDIPFSVKKAQSYGYDNTYVLKTINKNLHKISQGDSLTGTIEMLMEDRANNRYIYLIKGTYRGILIVRGEMIIDIKFTQEGANQKMDVKNYITFKNDVILETLKKLTFIDAFNRKIDRLINYNVNRIVKIGRLTAIRINHEEARY